MEEMNADPDDMHVTRIQFGTARIFTINSEDDLHAFMRMRRFSSPTMKYHYDGSTVAAEAYVDWTATMQAHDADAIHLTSLGCRETRGYGPSGTMKYSTNSWDVESTAWLHVPEIISTESVNPLRR